MLPPTITLLSLVLPLTASAALSADPNRKLRGVLPARRSLYTPTSSGTWKCLSGTQEISWDKVNDDFCDCPDGSDEPGASDFWLASRCSLNMLIHVIGTSACPNSTFYCVNEGHEGATISRTRVDDGLCGERGPRVPLQRAHNQM